MAHRISSIVLLIALTQIPEGLAAGRKLPPTLRSLAFDPPSSTLRLQGTGPLRVIPGDIVEVEVTKGAAGAWKIAEYRCRWEEEETSGFLIFKKRKKIKHDRTVPVQGRLGNQIKINASVPSESLALTEEPQKLLAAAPGLLTISGTVNTELPEKPHPDADCKRIPQPSGDVWFEISVKITRFDNS